MTTIEIFGGPVLTKLKVIDHFRDIIKMFHE